MEDSLGFFNYLFEFKPQLLMVLKSITQIRNINSMPHIWDDDKYCVNRRESILVNVPNKY